LPYKKREGSLGRGDWGKVLIIVEGVSYGRVWVGEITLVARKERGRKGLGGK